MEILVSRWILDGLKHKNRKSLKCNLYLKNFRWMNHFTENFDFLKFFQRFFKQQKQTNLKIFKHYKLKPSFSITKDEKAKGKVGVSTIWSSLIQFDQVWANLIQFDQVWANLNQFVQVWSIWSSLIQFILLYSNSIKFDHVWSNLFQFNPIWSSLCQIDPI